MKSVPRNCNNEKCNKSATETVEEENIDLLSVLIPSLWNESISSDEYIRMLLECSG